MTVENFDAREAQLSDIMYAIGMESAEATFHMQMLCRELEIPYPPVRIEPKKEKEFDEDSAENRLEWLYEVNERKLMDFLDSQSEMKK
jgi:hypothetical protein